MLSSMPWNDTLIQRSCRPGSSGLSRAEGSGLKQRALNCRASTTQWSKASDLRNNKFGMISSFLHSLTVATLQCSLLRPRRLCIAHVSQSQSKQTSFICHKQYYRQFADCTRLLKLSVPVVEDVPQWSTTVSSNNEARFESRSFRFKFATLEW